MAVVDLRGGCIFCVVIAWLTQLGPGSEAGASEHHRERDKQSDGDIAKS